MKRKTLSVLLTVVTVLAVASAAVLFSGCGEKGTAANDRATVTDAAAGNEDVSDAGDTAENDTTADTDDMEINAALGEGEDESEKPWGTETMAADREEAEGTTADQADAAHGSAQNSASSGIAQGGFQSSASSGNTSHASSSAGGTQSSTTVSSSPGSTVAAGSTQGSQSGSTSQGNTSHASVSAGSTQSSTSGSSSSASGSSSSASGSSSSAGNSTQSSTSSGSSIQGSTSEAAHTHNWVAQYEEKEVEETETVDILYIDGVEITDKNQEFRFINTSRNNQTFSTTTIGMIQTVKAGMTSYDEPIYEYGDQCNKCGYWSSDYDDFENHIDVCWGAYTTGVIRQTGTVHHTAKVVSETTVTGTHTETVLTGYKCSICGATK